MKTMTIWRAYRKAHTLAVWGKMRTKKQKERVARARRQYPKFELALVKRIMDWDERSGR